MNKKVKTINEMLEEALVSEEEQLYEIPDNWIWVRTNTTNEIVTGSTPSKQKSEYYGGDFPFVKPADLGQGSEVIHASEYLTKEGKAVSRTIPKESTMVCCIGSIGKTGFSVIECTTNQQINSLVPNKKIINSKFNYYQVINGIYQNELWNRSSATTVSIINKGKMSLIPYVLPPINEQNRIAEKVERLLSKIDDAIQLIEEAKETFEFRRAAILDKAFRGEALGSDFIQIDKKNYPYMLPETWEWKRFDEVARVCSSLVDPKSYPKLPHIAPDNIEKKTGRLLEYMTVEESKVKSSKHQFYKGQILYSKIRPYLSKVTLIEFDGLCSADMYPIETQLNIKYLYWYMLSPLFVERASTAGSRSVLPKINQKELGQIPVPVPSAEIQEKIVLFIEGLLSQEESTISYINYAVKSMETIKRSILSKAFSGELGTNDPTEESAIELLKEVLQVQSS